jgi:hypothetical protein
VYRFSQYLFSIPLSDDSCPVKSAVSRAPCPGRATSDYVSIHHIDGRTGPGCHLLVLPLCAGCHQGGTGNDKSLVAVHPHKTRSEKLHGNQLKLLDAPVAPFSAGGQRTLDLGLDTHAHTGQHQCSQALQRQFALAAGRSGVLAMPGRQ